MRQFRAPDSFRSTGRMRGCYVYLLMCPDGATIHLKAGMSDDPLARLREILVGCPIPASLLAVTELANRRTAYQAERELHRTFAAWHTTGEWFRLTFADKAAFNAAWKLALSGFSSAAWPIHWTKLNVAELVSHQRSLRAAKDRVGYLTREAVGNRASRSPR